MALGLVPAFVVATTNAEPSGCPANTTANRLHCDVAQLTNMEHQLISVSGCRWRCAVELCRE